MKPISPQKAKTICNQEGLDFSALRAGGGPYLLQTGAKLAWSQTQGYVIYGYDCNGHDIGPYCMPHGIELEQAPRPEYLRYAQVPGPKRSIREHIAAGNILRTNYGTYIIWCPDGIGRPTAWQKMNIGRLATFRVKATPYYRKKK